MEHWLPLFEDKMATLFDHLGAGAVIVRDIGVAAANEARFEAIADYHANRVRAQSSDPGRSEEHTSELQSLMRISYAVFCLKKKKTNKRQIDVNNDMRTHTDTR